MVLFNRENGNYSGPHPTRPPKFAPWVSPSEAMVRFPDPLQAQPLSPAEVEDDNLLQQCILECVQSLPKLRAAGPGSDNFQLQWGAKKIVEWEDRQSQRTKERFLEIVSRTELPREPRNNLIVLGSDTRVLQAIDIATRLEIPGIYCHEAYPDIYDLSNIYHDTITMNPVCGGADAPCPALVCESAQEGGGDL